MNGSMYIILLHIRTTYLVILVDVYAGIYANC